MLVELDDTAVVFTSDHGEMNGDWGLIYKMNFLDGALRVPLIVRWPRHTPVGATSDLPVSAVDFLPTFLDLAGVRPAEGVALDDDDADAEKTRDEMKERRDALRAAYVHKARALAVDRRARPDDESLRERPAAAWAQA